MPDRRALWIGLPIGAAVALLAGLALVTAPSRSERSPSGSERSPSAESQPPPRSSPPPPERSNLRSYALALPELRGLSPDTRPGARLELWVSWGPPITARPRLERLTRGVVLERIVPPLTPGAPDTALLLVPEREIADLLWADRYGSLSATRVPPGE